MLFSSSQFLFAFFPLCLTAYFIVHRVRVLSNIFLTLFSCAFYAYGEPKFIFIMLAVIIVDWLAALEISKRQGKKSAKIILIFAIAINLFILFLFKYLDFFITQINYLPWIRLPFSNLVMPIGISFFTFQSISYVIDVYREYGVAQKNLLYVIEYIALFPQLIAGPIVRYSDVAKELTDRKESLPDFETGCCRFIVGLGKKVLLSNSLAIAADCAFDVVAAGGSISILTAWIGAISYSLQIYFDFSGYSDMAIGLGRVFGFHFLENFNYPYVSKSITEFWRRWHMSLQTWFRDYVYIPLGGSKVSVSRRSFNLFVVWLLTGIWHGANWTFITWGLMYCVLLWMEKNLHLDRHPNVLTRIYTLFFVMIGWIIFRSVSLGVAVNYIGMLFGIGSKGLSDSLFKYIFHEYGIVLLLGLIGSLPIVNCITQWKNRIAQNIFYVVGGSVVLLLSVSYIVKGAYNPFIYFNF